MIVDGIVSLKNYWNHLGPLWSALHPSERGTLYTTNDLIHAHIPDSVLGCPVNSRLHPDPHPDRLLVAASWQDLSNAVHRPGILIEHGVGAMYDGNPANPGGTDRDNIVLYLCPNHRVARANLAVYPRSQAAVVGPLSLDPLLTARREVMPNRPLQPSDGSTGDHMTRGRWSATPTATDAGKPTIALAWHWWNSQHRYSGSAFFEFQDAAHDLTSHFTILGHGHPRMEKFWRQTYEKWGVEYVPDLVDVAARADLLIVDNSSAGYELAACDIPTVWVRSRKWRRDHLGPWPRFTDTIPGPEVDRPEDLLSTVRLALRDDPPWPQHRRRVLAEVYSDADGKSAERAVKAIRRYAEEKVSA